MKTVLIFDTETTGLFDFKAPLDDPKQPHLVQLAASLEEEESGIELASLSLVIRPEGWTIPDEVAILHGISQEMAAEVGVPCREAVQLFLSMAMRACTVCAHNLEFDEKVIARELQKDVCRPKWLSVCKEKGFCTMQNMNKIMKKGKWPKLKEAYAFLFNQEIEGAHNAMVDVRACARIYHDFMRKEKDNGGPAKP